MLEIEILISFKDFCLDKSFYKEVYLSIQNIAIKIKDFHIISCDFENRDEKRIHLRCPVHFANDTLIKSLEILINSQSDIEKEYYLKQSNLSFKYNLTTAKSDHKTGNFHELITYVNGICFSA
ncbi:MAG TPA: hypothetical protein DIW54_13035 [Chitinophagaceae bacterium]|nr:hypothetical protein [Chitinophagaceae bacterium]